MAVSNFGDVLPFVAGEAIPAYRLVALGQDGNGSVEVNLADSGIPTGATEVNPTASGSMADVRLLVSGQFILTASEAIDAGEPVKVAADGKVQDATAGEYGVIGHALEDASANGDLIAVLVNPALIAGSGS